MRRGRLIGLTAAVSLIALAYGGYVWWESRKHVATDDAYVEGNIVVISAKVAGHVAELLVDEHRAGTTGDILLRIDPRDYAARRDQARAAVAVAAASQEATRSETQLTRETTAAQVEEARATLESARVAEQAAQSAVVETRATLEAKHAATAAMTAEVTGTQSTQRQTAREKERMRRLLEGGFVAQRGFDQAEMTAGTAAATLEATTRRLNQAEKEAQQAEAALTSRILAVNQARQRINEARAARGRHAQPGAGRPRLRGAAARARGGAGARRRGGVEEERGGGAGGADGPAPLGPGAPARRLGRGQLQGDAALARAAGNAGHRGGRHLPRRGLPRHRRLAQRGDRRALLAAAARERDRELGEGGAARAGEDPPRSTGAGQSPHPAGRDVGLRRHPGEVASRWPRRRRWPRSPRPGSGPSRCR